MTISSAYIFGKQLTELSPVASNYIFQNGSFSQTLCPAGVRLDNSIVIVGDGQVDPEGWDYYAKVWNDAENHGSLKDYYGTNKIIVLLGSSSAVPFSMSDGEIERITQVPTGTPDLNQLRAAIMIPVKIPKGQYTYCNYRRIRYQGWGCWGNNMCYGATTMYLYEITSDDNLAMLSTHYNCDRSSVQLNTITSDTYSDKPATAVNGQYDPDYTYGYIKIEAGDIIKSKVQSIWLS